MDIKDPAIVEGRKLPIMEHFYTIQGEGHYSGEASYFIRIGGCDVGCHWCDVKESWDPSIHPLIWVDEIVDTAVSYSKLIVLTGGEPLMWNLDYITKGLKEKGCQINIETSGAYAVSGILDWICLSPKKKQLPLKENYLLANELKVIIHNLDDLKFAEKQANQVSKECLLYLQPEWSKAEQITPKIVDYVMAHPRWRISLQTHKYLNIP